ncbi:MAG: hypothetical protein EKK29_01525 [Hyphomicrobiales bacterium]|nr:MAG: hypothetical protein EKK29_01525 [Hyphomicrobiales bacterium]
MNLLEFGKPRGPNDLVAPQVTKGPGSIKSYDSLAGSALLRRAGKAAGAKTPLRGDQASNLIASRRKEAPLDQLGRELSNYYEFLLSQPIPERLVALVEALDARPGR